MVYSAENTALWSVIIQFGILAAAVCIANVLRRKIPFFRKSLLPTAVLAGFLLLLVRAGLSALWGGDFVNSYFLNNEFLETITYHGIAIGFIAMSLRVNNDGSDKSRSSALVGAKSGALIVATYLVQAIVGLLTTLVLSYTVLPKLFRASGVLLPMGYGQGPGQANNIGSSYEALGFVGGRSFGLALAAAGYVVACIMGVIMLNVLSRKGQLRKVSHEDLSGSVTVDTFQDKGEIPLSESLDKFSMQAALVVITYLITFLVTWGITSAVSAISESAGNTVNSILWGFNFIIGSLVAILVKLFLKSLRKTKIMDHQYQNNYLLNRISGLAFDFMIVAGIASINIEDLSGLWIPFLILAVLGAASTWLFLALVCKAVYRDYYYEGLLSMFGMLTGTISSGVLLLREIDPEYQTPAANNLVLGSSFGIAFGFPMLILVGIAPNSDLVTWIVLGVCVVYLSLLLLFIYRFGNKKKK